MTTHVILRTLGICVFGFFFVVASVQFYIQPHPPTFPIFHEIYHVLRGEPLDPSGARPFPNGEFEYNQSAKVNTGMTGPEVYARVGLSRIADDATQVVVIFNSPKGQTLPKLSVLAPKPTIHVAGQVFPARSVATDNQPAAEMKYNFTFPPLSPLDDTEVRFSLNEKGSESFTLSNPAPRPAYFEERGPNVWVAVVLLSGIGLIVLASKGDSGGTARDNLLKQWKAIDEQREEIAEELGGMLHGSAAKAERRKAALESLNRAEQILMQSHSENLQAELWKPWVMSAVILLCLFGVLLVTPLLTHITSRLATDHAAAVGQLPERVRLLEQDHTKLFLLLAGILVGALGIASNLGLSMWRTKRIARKTIRNHLREFDNILKAELLAKLQPAERSIRNGLLSCSGLGRELDGSHERLLQRFKASKNDVAESVKDELLAIANLQSDASHTGRTSRIPDKGTQT